VQNGWVNELIIPCTKVAVLAAIFLLSVFIVKRMLKDFPLDITEFIREKINSEVGVTSLVFCGIFVLLFFYTKPIEAVVNILGLGGAKIFDNEISLSLAVLLALLIITIIDMVYTLNYVVKK
jgi:hypothetical protein